MGGEGGGVDGQCMSCKTPNNNVYFRCIKVGHGNGDNYLHQLDFMSFFFGVEMLSSVKFCEKKLDEESFCSTSGSYHTSLSVCSIDTRP